MSKSILVIDDDQYIREVYEELLKDSGYQVTTASDGQEGLSKIETGTFDLILLDIMMPKLDGIEVLKSLKGNPPKAKNGPIVMLTNMGHDQVIKEGLSLGAKSYLVKSEMNPDQLLEKLKKWL